MSSFARGKGSFLAYHLKLSSGSALSDAAADPVVGAAAWDGCLPFAFAGVFPLEVLLPRPLGPGLFVASLPLAAGPLSFPFSFPLLPLSFPFLPLLLLDLSLKEALAEGADVGAEDLPPVAPRPTREGGK